MEKFNWNEDAEAQLRDGLENGLSFMMIAAQIGCGRNSAIGKAHRLGLKSKNAKNVIDKPSDQKISKAIKNIRMHRFQRVAPMPVEPFVEKVAEVKSLSGPKTLMQLKPHDCRWPQGTPGKSDFLFCGSPTAQQPYCVDHSKIAFRGRN